MAAHRSGPLKQQNKAHKGGRHRGRGSAQRDGKGRVELKILCKKVRKELSRVDQRHRANQLRKQKKEAVLAEKRQLGSKDGPPHQVLVVALHNRISLSEAFRLLQDRDMGTVHLNEWGSTYSFMLLCPRLKHRWFFTSARPGDLHSVLDMAKVADTILFLLDPQEGWDSTGDYCLSCLFAQGLPTYTLAVQGFSGIPLKKQIDARKKLSKAVEKRFPDDRLLLLDTQQEAATLLRQLANQKRRHLAFRDRRAYLFTHAADFVPSEENKLVGTLKISGYVRGQTLNVNSLLHIVGHGDFQMKQIDAPIDPFPLNPKVIKSQKDSGMAMEVCASDVASDMEEDLKVLMKADPDRQESLQTEVIPDPMEGEQTWPTEEELSEAKDYLKEGSKVVKKVPKGTSSYQAEWILDEGGESGGERDEDDDTEQDFMEEESQDEKSEEEEEECETMTIGDSVRDDLYDEKMDEEAEEKMLEKYKQERMEEMFPDEMDTPRDVAAKIRFQKYRGLKSFRTSPWDPKENLPRDYARIFQFQNFTNTRKRIFKEIEEKEDEGAEVGWYVTLHVSEVPFSVVEYFRKGAPLIAFSLLPHEQKMSVLNMVVSRNPGYTEPVKAKEELIFHCGFRRFRASPLFSQHTADKHKLQRFLTADVALVVTIYAPITFPPASVLLFKQQSNGMHSLVATGHLLSVDPDRMVIKRVVLSGHPFKIFTKMAVVRYMFFNREDVLWFKPVELRTKWGRRGHIREPLGTHGHMKCSFDGKLKSQDTVLMNLYKRVFPKWTYDPYVPEPVPWVKSEISSTVPELDME
nr:pre-rRNA-processing protein TSR1 homolog isoform X2 [Marmota flaviventris]